MKKLRFYYLEIIIISLTIFARVVPGPRTVDDAYITFRYAQNIIDGSGMVYNPGERVLGTTTPIYSFTMAILGSALGGIDAPYPWIALLVNTIADVLTAILLIRLGQSLGHRRAGYATAFIWAIAPMSVTFAIGGMETSVFVCLMIATFYFYSKGSLVPASLMASLSLLTRPDALLFILPLGLDRLRRAIFVRQSSLRERISFNEVAVFALPTLLWVAFAFLYFGNPLPNSIAAKTAAYLLPREAALVRLLQHYATPFLGHLAFGRAWIILGVILFPIVFGLGALRAIRKNNSSWAILAYPWIYMIAFSIANPLIFRWYLTPPLPVYFLGIFMGVERIAQDIKRPLLTSVVAVVAFALTANGWTLHPDHGPDRPAPEMAYIKLELMYEEVGRELKNKIASDETLAAGDIGALGYFSSARILDTVGLITPQVAHYYPLPESYYEINYAIAPNLILDYKPDYLVILEIYGRHELIGEPEFEALYKLKKRIDTDIYGTEGMLIFERAGAK